MTYYTPSWSMVDVTGPDAVKFVQNLCTNDIARMPEGHACEAFFCDVKGRIQAHTIVCRTPDGCRVVVTSARAADLAAHIDRYHIREDLQIDAPQSPNLVLCFGGADQEVGAYPVDGLAAQLALSPPAAGRPLSEEEFQLHRIKHAFPLDGVDVDEHRLPQEVNRNALAISFTKGCYLGQETVARIDALGHVNRLLKPCRLAGQASVVVGDTWQAEGKTVAQVTSVAYAAEEDATYVLGYLRAEAAVEGAHLQTPSGQATVLAAPA